jgi:hypothetical protein
MEERTLSSMRIIHGFQAPTRGVCGLPIYILKVGMLRQKKNYGKLKYFTIQEYNLKRNPLKATKILRDIRTL